MAGRVNRWDTYTNDDLLELLKCKQKELNRKVTVKDLGNKNNMPSPSYFFKKFETWSLNEILEMADLNIDNIQKIPQEEAIEKLKKHYRKLGRIPTRKDFEELQLKPYYDYYSRNFGSYDNACYLAGIKDRVLNKEERIDISINKLIDLANEIGKCPTIEDYDNNRGDGYPRRNLEKHLNMSWSEICHVYLPRHKLNVNRKITECDIKKDIKYVVNKIGKVPTYKEYRLYSIERYSLSAFYSAVGLTYNKTLIKFGYNPVGISTEIRTEQELLRDFENLFKKLKRIPYLREIDDDKDCASSATYKKYFGSIENVCNLLDIDYNEYYRSSGAGLICYDLNGNLCKSIAERDISNFFISNGITSTNEPSYSEVFNNDNRKFDWKIYLDGDYYYVEYFGMYNNNPRGNIGRKYKNNAHKKVKDLYKLNIIDSCIFIFPSTLKNFGLVNIFSKYTKKTLVEYISDDSQKITFYSQLSATELFNEVLKFCENGEFVKAYELRVRCSGLYDEILLRYGGYYEFTQAFSIDYKYRQHYWSKDRVFRIMNYMISTYNEIMPRNKIYNMKHKDKNLDNITSAYRKYGYSNLKLEYFENHNGYIPQVEKEWLTNVSLKKGSGCKQLDADASVRAYNILLRHNLV